MQIKTSDFFDKWLILIIKAKYDENAKKELELYKKEVIGILYKKQDSVALYGIIESIVELMEANARTWENESSIRNEFENDPSNTHFMVEGKKLTIEQLSEIGRRALLIRSYNRLRINAKKKIDVEFGDIPDTKVNHASQ